MTDSTTTPADYHDRADAWWASAVDVAIRTLASTGAPFTTADLRDMGVTEPDSPNRWGAALSAAHRSGVIAPCGFTRSTRRERRNGVVRQWIGAEAVAR